LVLGKVRYAADVNQRSTAKWSVKRGSASSGQSQYKRQGHKPPKMVLQWKILVTHSFPLSLSPDADGMVWQTVRM